MRATCHWTTLLWFTCLAFCSDVVNAHEDHTGPLEELVVYGRAEEQLGVATAASSGQVGEADIQLAARMRVGELVESVPGMVATQHSGTGKANQYFLRGFNLDHGTDFSAHAQGVPLNMRTHGHGQGYLDLNFIIPEMVATTKFRKGPYHASVGDFSSAGTVEFLYYDRLPEPVLSASLGENGYQRGLAAGSIEAGRGVLTGAIDLTRYDGPWDLSEDLQQDKFQFRYAFSLGDAQAVIDLQGYEGRWNSTDQIPARAVRSGLIDELGFIDPDLGGSTDRYALTASVNFTDWALTAYAVDYDFSLYSNFTYFLDDPVSGDEFEQRDSRRVYGFNLDGSRALSIGERLAAFNWGIQARVDDIDLLGLYQTQARIRNGVIRADSVTERSLGAYGELELGLSDRLRAIAGLRADYYNWDVHARQAVNEGSDSDAIVTPKVSFAYRVTDSVEAYANWGRGFHSNDVRGATITVDPLTGQNLSPADALVPTKGAETGVRFERGKRFNAALVAFWLELDSELVFVGDAGGTEASSGSERTGVEASLFWQATDWLALDMSYTYTDAEFSGSQPEGNKIPGAVESTGSLGLSAIWPNGFFFNTRVRYLGEAPLIEDGSVEADSSVLVNAGVGYRTQSIEMRVDMFNVFDSDDQDISYLYTSRLPGEAGPAVEDIHFHPLGAENSQSDGNVAPCEVLATGIERTFGLERAASS